MQSISTTISGSFRKFPERLKRDMEEFRDLGVLVRSPKSASIVCEETGFVSLRGDVVPRIDRVSMSDMARAMGHVENSHLEAIAQSDFLWLMAPGGYCGPSASLEMGWARALGKPIYTALDDYLATKEPLVLVYAQPVTSIASLVANYDPAATGILNRRQEEQGLITFAEQAVSQTYSTTPTGFIICVGAIIEDHSGDKRYKEGEFPEVLFFACDKWGGRYTVSGGKVRPGETLDHAFMREISQEETRLPGTIGRHIAAFNRIKGSGYYMEGKENQADPQTIFIDRVFRAGRRDFVLNEENQEGVWLPPEEAYKNLDLEPNAKKTLAIYLGLEQ